MPWPRSASENFSQASLEAGLLWIRIMYFIAASLRSGTFSPEMSKPAPQLLHTCKRCPEEGAGERRRQMGEQSGINISRVRTIGVPVTDQERALEFYLSTLGFTTRIDVTLGADLRWIE